MGQQKTPARLPFYGSAHGAVRSEVVLPWLDAILAFDWKKAESAAFAGVVACNGRPFPRLAGNAPSVVIRRLEALGTAPARHRMLRETAALDEADAGGASFIRAATVHVRRR
jgi:uncharacterized protein DUF3731